MDPERFREAYAKLQLLDERLAHKVRPRAHSMSRLSLDQLEDRVRDLAEFTIELRQVVDDLFQAIAAKPGDPAPDE